AADPARPVRQHAGLDLARWQPPDRRMGPWMPELASLVRLHLHLAGMGTPTAGCRAHGRLRPPSRPLALRAHCIRPVLSPAAAGQSPATAHWLGKRLAAVP